MHRPLPLVGVVLCLACPSPDPTPSAEPTPTPLVEPELPAGDRHQRWLNRALSAIEDGDLEAGEARLAELDAARPGDPAVLVGRAVLLRDAGRGADALALLPGDSQDHRVQLLRVELLLGAGQLEEAMAALDRLVEGRPDDPGVRYLRAQRRLFGDQAEGALEDLSEADRVLPGNGEIAVARAEALLSLDRLAEALAVLRPFADRAEGGAERVAALEGGDIASRDLRILRNLVAASPRTLADRQLLALGAAQQAIARLSDPGPALDWTPAPLRFEATGAVQPGTGPLARVGGAVWDLGSGTLLSLGAEGLGAAEPGAPQSPQGAARAAVLKDAGRLWVAAGGLWIEGDEGLRAHPLVGEPPPSDVRPLLFDFDQDADPELLLLDADGALQYRAGSGDGGFSPAVPLAAGVATLALLDADQDGNFDLLVGGPGGPRLLHNAGHGVFREAQLEGGSGAVCAADLDGDWHPEALEIGAQSRVLAIPQEALAIGPYTLRGRGRPGRELNIEWADAAPGPIRDCVASDLDGDGTPELLLSSATHLHLVQRSAPGQWQERWQQPARSALLTDADGDGDRDLVVAGEAGLQLFRNEGGESSGWLSVVFDATKDSREGYGSRAQVMAGLHSAQGVLLPAFGSIALDARALPLSLGGRPLVDRAKVIWPNRIWQDAIDLTPGPLTLTQDAGLVGSCPFLFAWDGTRFTWVNDLLGNAPLGLPMGPGASLPAEPHELMRIPEGMLQARDGAFQFRLTDELREVTFLDRVALVTVDHPAGTRVYADQGVRPPPWPEPALWVVGAEQAPETARDGSGASVLEALRAEDEVYAGATRPGPFPGTAAPHVVELTFSEVPEDALLVAYGAWYWGEASAYAGPQALEWRSQPLALSRSRDGGPFEPIPLRLPIPGGRPKWVAAEVGDLLAAGDVLRIESNWQIYWDRFALAPIEQRLTLTDEAVTVAAPQHAALRWRGYSQRVERAGPPPTFDYQKVDARRPYPRMSGWYTAYGDVRSQLTRSDDLSIVVGHGEEVDLRFPPREGSHFFYSVGWDKDGDPKTAWGETLEPWPSIHDVAYPPAEPPPGDYTRTRWVP